MSAPVTVSTTTGWWNVAGTWLGALGIGGVLIAIVGSFVPWRKQTLDRESKFMDDIMKRLTKVEKQLETERRAHRIEIARVEARAAAQRSLDRHRFNNAEGSFDALLTLLEAAELPEKLLIAIGKVRERRLVERNNEKLEAATIHAAEMDAIAKAQQDLDAEERDAA